MKTRSERLENAIFQVSLITTFDDRMRAVQALEFAMPLSAHEARRIGLEIEEICYQRNNK